MEETPAALFSFAGTHERIARQDNADRDLSATSFPEGR